MKALAADVAAERNPEKFQDLVRKPRDAHEDFRPPKPAKPGADQLRNRPPQGNAFLRNYSGGGPVERSASRVVASEVFAGDAGLACSCPNPLPGLFCSTPAEGAYW